MLQLLVTLILAFSGSYVSARKPNILVLILDDYREIDAGPDAPPISPHIELFKHTATEFTRAYAQFPQCGPSRDSFLTGLRPNTSDIFVSDLLPRKMPRNIHQMLRGAGYLVGTAGKVYHRATHHYPAEWFDDSDVSNGGFGNLGFPFKVCPSQTRTCTCAETPDPLDPNACRDYGTKMATESMIRAWSNATKPWFITAGFVRPHADYRVPKWASDAGIRYAHTDPGNHLNTDLEPIDHIKWGKSNKMAARLNSYATAVHATDRYIGDVLRVLYETGQTDHTAIVLMSDHGMQFGDQGMDHFAKWTLTDSVLRVPFMLRYPGQRGHERRDDVVELVDLVPTILDIAGVEFDENDFDGQSLNATSTKDVAFAWTPVCSINRKGVRNQPCTTRQRGGAKISAFGKSVITPDSHTVEWTKTERSPRFCRHRRRKCPQRWCTTLFDVSSNRKYCVPNLS